MLESFKLDFQSVTPIYKQIENFVIQSVSDKDLRKGDKIPSINDFCREFSIAPGTVNHAYENLRQNGVIESKQGKGYFIRNESSLEKLNILIIFDRLNAYKEILYNTIFENLVDKANIQLFFHHYDKERFCKIIEDNLGKYHYYVVMPHFNEDVSAILKPIPPQKLIIIDKEVPKLKGKYSSVHQDFYADIQEGLNICLPEILKFEKINMLISESKFQFIPQDCVKGFTDFCESNSVQYTLIRKFSLDIIRKKQIYFVFSDLELFAIIKYSKTQNWEIGKDIGIISIDDTPMKEILVDGITTFSTDFVGMGKTVATMIIEGQKAKVRNKFLCFRRKSF